MLSVIVHLGGVYILAKDEPAGGFHKTYQSSGTTANTVYLTSFNTKIVSSSSTADLKNMAGLNDSSKPEKIGNKKDVEVSVMSPSTIDETKVQMPFALPTFFTEPYYFLAKDLTQMPVVVLDVPARLTLTATDVPAGSAILHILISEYGDVDKVIMEDSVLSEADQSMLVAAFLRTKFQPGEINGMPVKSELKIEMMPAE